MTGGWPAVEATPEVIWISDASGPELEFSLLEQEKSEREGTRVSEAESDEIRWTL